MKFKELQAKGGFVDETPVEKSVVWRRAGPDGAQIEDAFTIHVKRLSFGAIERAFAVDKKDPERNQWATLIASAILLDDGKERLTYQQAYQLDPSLAAVFMAAIGEVNETSGAEASKN